ncbi:hypothetical protein [Bailinhaonella thermotolerans]|uniref:hypothetical protein n=1 Tax=Bailinhaonella thermotolerans TaxID=1070861 RepID=UPI003BEF44D7
MLLYAGRDDTRDATLYTSRAPCSSCMKLIQASCIRLVVSPGPPLHPPANTAPPCLTAGLLSSLCPDATRDP